ncbi:hypothetical protein [Alkalihalobacillus deserti]|uniref:hypothetical protein n=1 Tax=Alkalihalobacillus deserti TaxID=2879466 RepID=UPI001D14453C|nr:hypothetical protein [Alkalihalobacillus deserti]
MFKQLLVISLAVIMFVGVWVLVLFQFNNQKEPFSFDFNSSSEANNERTFDFPDSVKRLDEKEQLVGTDNENNSNSISEVIEEQISSQVTKQFIDLRDYDFSDVSSVNGIPIDAILEKLKIE